MMLRLYVVIPKAWIIMEQWTRKIIPTTWAVEAYAAQLLTFIFRSLTVNTPWFRFNVESPAASWFYYSPLTQQQIQDRLKFTEQLFQNDEVGGSLSPEALYYFFAFSLLFEIFA